MNRIAHIYTDFPEKFGIPRQSGVVDALAGKIIFEPEYRTPEAFRGLDGFSHIWILWEFSEAKREKWVATVKPPRLGGNQRMGVFATRSPFRPNPIGLSSVKLERIEMTQADGPVLYVSGIDMMDGTPIYDIKPYLPYTDSHPDARAGFAADVYAYALTVTFPEDLLNRIREEKREGLLALLRQDPRPAYQNDPNRVYGVAYAGYNIRFTVHEDSLVVCGVDLIK